MEEGDIRIRTHKNKVKKERRSECELLALRLEGAMSHRSCDNHHNLENTSMQVSAVLTRGNLPCHHLDFSIRMKCLTSKMAR